MYLLKFLGASILLYLIYYFLLRNEKTFRFNRFYLLSILVLAAIIPLVVVKTTIIEIPYQEPLYNLIPGQIPETVLTTANIEEDHTLQINWLLIGQVTYSLISFVFFLRFFLNLNAIRNLRKSGEEITFKELPLIQNPQVRTTFSFLSRVFVNKAEFKKEGLADEIFDHEQVHIKQKHSLDIIFIELINCLIWFNPVVHFIRRNIKLNHEYLADAGVIAKSEDPNAYQLLLLNHTSKQMILNPLLASHLSYGETKQRFKIMFKTTNKTVAALKQFAALVLIAGLFLAFGGEEVIAQEQVSDVVSATKTETQEDKPVVGQLSKKPKPSKPFRINKFTKVRYQATNGQMIEARYGELDANAKSLFASKEGKGMVFIPPPPPALIEQSRLDKFSSDAYEVKIDGEVIPSKNLLNYKPEDFYLYITYITVNDDKSNSKVTGINFLTRKNYNTDGKWIAFKPGLVEINKSRKETPQES